MNTNEYVAGLRKANPCLSLQRIGDKVNLSRERIRQILRKAGLPTAGITVKAGQFQCGGCGGSYSPRPIKPSVKQAKYDRKLFCSMACAFKYHLLTLACETCGVTFLRPQSGWMGALRRGYGNHIFCSKQCSGKWTGNTYGFTAHPENWTGRPRKWNYEQIWELRSHGLECREIMAQIGIARCSLENILYNHKEELQVWRENKATISPLPLTT